MRFVLHSRLSFFYVTEEIIHCDYKPCFLYPFISSWTPRFHNISHRKQQRGQQVSLERWRVLFWANTQQWLVNRFLWNADMYSFEQILRSGFTMPFLGIREASTPISTVTRLVSIPTRSVYSVPFVQVYSMCFHDDCCSDWDMRELECCSNLH